MSRKNLMFVAAAVLALGGCAEPPTEQVTQSQGAVDAAQTAEAETWAGAEWQEAQQAMAAAEGELLAQEQKLAPTRNYARTSELLQAAVQKAEAARTAALANKEAARQAALEALEMVRTSLQVTRELSVQLAGCPSQPKGFEADLALVTGNLQVLETEVGPIESLLESEGFSSVEEEADELGQRIEVLRTDLESAMSKIGCQPTTSAPPPVA